MQVSKFSCLSLWTHLEGHAFQQHFVFHAVFCESLVGQMML